MTLVELMVVVAIVGVLASLALYVGIVRYLASAKIAEAKEMLGAISRSAVSAFERETTYSEIVNEGNKSVASSHALCNSAVPVPQTMSAVKGVQYQPDSTPGKDFETGDSLTGWRCLRFTVSSPIYYQYGYTRGASVIAQGGAAVSNGFEAVAQGDIDGDGTPSHFALTGELNPTTGTIRVSSQVYYSNEFE